MYFAEVAVGFGTGAPRHQFWGGYGSAFSKSPKKAIRQAQRAAERAAGEGASWCLISQRTTLTNLQTGKTQVWW